MSNDMITQRGWVEGKVQGVWFRRFVATRAGQHGVGGYAKNLDDGRVEVMLCGTSQAVALVAAQVAIGPPAARVDQVMWRAAEPGPLSFGSFEIL